MTRVVNATRGVTLAERAQVADTFLRRLRGLLGRRGWGADDGLWIEPCAGLHALGMSFPVDAILVDEGLRVLWARTLRPWRLGAFHLEARAALELPAGTLETTGTRPGDVLELRVTSES
jgi:uncharacterized membrane protein (UPF0127 family)